MAIPAEVYGWRIGRTNPWHCVVNGWYHPGFYGEPIPLSRVSVLLAESRRAAPRKAALRFSFARAGRSRALLALCVPLAPPAIGRLLLEQIQAPLRKRPQPLGALLLFLEKSRPGLRSDPVVGPAVSPEGAPFHHAGADQGPGGHAHTASAPVEHVGEVLRGLRLRIAHQQPAQHAAPSPRQPEILVEHPHLVREADQLVV